MAAAFKVECFNQRPFIGAQFDETTIQCIEQRRVRLIGRSHRHLGRVVWQQRHQLGRAPCPPEGVDKTVPRDSREPVPELGFILELTAAADDFRHRDLKQVAGKVFVPTREHEQIAEEPIAVTFVEVLESRLVAGCHARGHAADALGALVWQRNYLVAHDRFGFRSTAKTLPDRVREGKVGANRWPDRRHRFLSRPG